MEIQEWDYRFQCLSKQENNSSKLHRETRDGVSSRLRQAKLAVNSLNCWLDRPLYPITQV